MSRGKDICKELKAVRRRIADENNIPLEIPKCTYKGPCAGTCPRCEWELRQLETALADRIRLGKVATVAGIALGLSVSANAQAEVTEIEIGTPIDSTHQEIAKGCLKGVVTDASVVEHFVYLADRVFLPDAHPVVVVFYNAGLEWKDGQYIYEVLDKDALLFRAE